MSAAARALVALALAGCYRDSAKPIENTTRPAAGGALRRLPESAKLAQGRR